MRHEIGTERFQTPPLLPLVDVLLGLLLFLVLVADFGPRKQEPLLVPKAFSTNECTMGMPPTAFTVNVHHRVDRTCPAHARDQRCEEEGHWTVTVHGIECSDSRALERALVRFAPQDSSGTERGAVVRSDANAPFGLAQEAIDACARQGFRKISVATRYPRSNR